jgi:hypothetical protein
LKDKLLLMEPTQPSTTSTSAPAPGIFGTKIPATVAFAVGVLLFLLPFAEIKCSGTTLANTSGLDIAMKKDWKPANNSLLGKEGMGDKTSKPTSQERGNSWIFAIAALGLGVVGLLLSFANVRSAAGGALVTGILSAGALIGMMLDMKKWFNDSLAKDAIDKAKEHSDNTLGLNNLGNSFNNMKPTLDFTPWFYVAVVAFLAAAFFSYRRMASMKT